jgi:pimeloyl-ACP methyl ester carboxylesterase
MRARLPDESGYVVNSGVRIHYEVHGTGQPTILLLPTWAIVDSRHWKMQVPFLARDYRVITFDPRGNGRSDRPRSPAAYADAVFASDAAAVLDATGTERAVLAGFCSGFGWALLFAAAHPQRVTGIVAIAPTLPIPPADPSREGGPSFDDVLDTTQGWAKENRHYWRRDWRGYVEFFMSQVTTDPHSTKPYDDLVEWGMQTDAETMLCDADAAAQVADEQVASRLCRSLTCPVLVIGGDQDKIVPPERVRRIAELTSAELLVIEGAGHAVHARYPVAVNHAIRDFVGRVAGRPRQRAVWPATHSRPRRALWISSPIGLGHVQRDLAIARALRQRVPDLEIHWWAQSPVTQVLAGAGEVIHPASSDLVSESAHWESESAHHDLPAFYAFRRMDEILCANYLRSRLGYPQDRPLLVAAVGGTAAGISLLELTCDAFARLRKQVPDARMQLVTGPRIDPRLLPDIEGMDKHGYVPDLFEHLACADAAIVQGGLSTTMELVATGRPFIYFPLRRHWEQQHFVTHRLNHYRAGLRMDYPATTADDLATTMRAALAEAGTRPAYRKVPRGGAGRAAGRIAGLLTCQ